ncbi:recombinase family protein [Blastomonas marina]|uniref:recombinase family protein n=1 Tax=Blastomonas marina TaxID=1867408 RepID=UPI002AC89FA9|nr:recombinase family protein [Blastomonas marina]WPZ04150.1 recombinase family protein [Blastomonas marina]
MAENGKQLRCAIYTRKSTEEGLEKEFNSLDAQHEACAAYILSQAHEGWTRLADRYDDGGCSGGNMERPALKRLLADVAAGQVDVVVVYKIDRLTRSLADFAKIVDTFDAADCSFVSVTQSFNTTSSMGRLTLNVLLSFAQFEREVAAERIRDKIAASKKRGMWMGGPVPLGYEVQNRKLRVVEKEAETVRDIMRRYLKSDGVPSLVDELERVGIVSKRRKMRDGSIKGGTPFRRGALAHLLSNRIYLGQITHKGHAYDGEHAAIVNEGLFEQVQKRLAEHRSGQHRKAQKAELSILVGRIFDEHCRPMSPCHTSNHGKRYRYYASVPRDGSSEKAIRFRAGDIENAVVSALVHHLNNPTELMSALTHLDDKSKQDVIIRASTYSDRLRKGDARQKREMISSLDLRVLVGPQNIQASIDTNPFLDVADASRSEIQRSHFEIATLPATNTHGSCLKLDPPSGSRTTKNDALLDLLARAFDARDRLASMNEEDVKALPIRKRRHMERTARLSYLAPDIVVAIMDGEQPAHLSARKLVRAASLPLDWAAQRRMLLQD